MNIIEKVRLRWKAWRGILSIDEFSYLVSLAETSAFHSETPDSKSAQNLLKTRFRKVLSPEEMDILINPSNLNVQELWLKMLSERKQLTDSEQKILVGFIPWHSLRRFPKPLTSDYLNVLFAERNPLKIISYCRDYTLPCDFEKMLVEQYLQSLQETDKKMNYRWFGKEKNGWAEALDVYLQNSLFDMSRFSSSELQKLLLNLDEPKLFHQLIKRSSIAANLLSDDVVWDLVNRHDEKALRLLLYKSYLPNISTLLRKVEKEMPQLKNQLDIARYRREIYLLEQKYHIFLGASYPTHREHHIICQHIGTSRENIEYFEEGYIQPLINTFKPCMCAYIAYHFPQLAYLAHKTVERYYHNCLETYHL